MKILSQPPVGERGIREMEKDDLRHLHAYWRHIQMVFNEALESGLEGAEEAIVKDLYNKLGHYYNTTQVISKKFDEMWN